MVNEARISARCITLVENLLREEYSVLRSLQERGKNTAMTEFKIARFQYALGERENLPSFNEFKERMGIV